MCFVFILEQSATCATYTKNWFVRGGADKYLAQPGSKQATATKLGIYSTYFS